MATQRLFFFLLFPIYCHAQEFPEVDTPLGRVRGYYQTSYEGRTISAFEGIPYAKAPVAELRFEEPQEVEPWLGVWEANKTYICPQLNTLAGVESVTGEEDCLYINVYVPRERPNSTDNLDVIATIHGGAFIVGYGHALAFPGFLLDRDLILVSFNYRLGLLGFLSTEDEVVPGNNGLKDQAFALKWIQKNIKSFGGNPNSVTIDGQSAGAGSVHYHYVSSLSKGLFHRGFSHSGSVLNPWATQKASLERAIRLAASVGCVADNSTRILVQCLKQRPASQLIENTKMFNMFGVTPISSFSPAIEGNVTGAFLVDHPYKLLSEGKINDVPWINSYTTGDGSAPGIYLLDQLDSIEEQWYTVAQDVLDCNYTLSIEDRNETFRKIKSFYFGNGTISTESAIKFIELCTDRYFKLAAIRASQIQSKVANSSVYTLEYGYIGSNSITGWNTSLGVGHGDDLLYLYGSFSSNILSDSDEKIKNFWLDLFTSYTATGVPNITDVNWEPSTSSVEQLKYLELVSPEQINLRNNSNYLEAIEFWDGLPFKENQQFVP